jgi:hypothetical protein
MAVSTLQPKTPTPHDYVELSEFHDCDQCSAQAYVQVFFETGYLLFCAHHFTKNQEGLQSLAKYINDRRDLLEPSKTL